MQQRRKSQMPTPSPIGTCRLARTRKKQPVFPTAAARAPTVLQLRHHCNNKLPRRIRIETETPQLTPIEPPPLLNKTRQTPKLNPSAIVPPLRLRISNFSNRCRIVKNFAPDCCNNSTPSLLLATPLVGWS